MSLLGKADSGPSTLNHPLLLGIQLSRKMKLTPALGFNKQLRMTEGTYIPLLYKTVK